MFNPQDHRVDFGFHDTGLFDEVLRAVVQQVLDVQVIAQTFHRVGRLPHVQPALVEQLICQQRIH